MLATGKVIHRAPALNVRRSMKPLADTSLAFRRHGCLVAQAKVPPGNLYSLPARESQLELILSFQCKAPAGYTVFKSDTSDAICCRLQMPGQLWVLERKFALVFAGPGCRWLESRCDRGQRPAFQKTSSIHRTSGSP